MGPTMMRVEMLQLPAATVHMNGRVYSPETGRFLSPDPLVQAPTYSQSFNRYSYVWNNPLNNIDPSGYANIGTVHDSSQLGSDETKGNKEGEPEDAPSGYLCEQDPDNPRCVKDSPFGGTYSNCNNSAAGVTCFDGRPEGTRLRNEFRDSANRQYRFVNTAGGGWQDPQASTVGYDGWYYNDTEANSSDYLILGLALAPALAKLFGKSRAGAEALLRNLAQGKIKLPSGITRDVLLRYRQLAEKAIKAGKDKLGVQALRRDAIDEILKK